MGRNSDHIAGLIGDDQPQLDPTLVQRAANWLAAHSCWSVGALGDADLQTLVNVYTTTPGNTNAKLKALRDAVKAICET